MLSLGGEGGAHTRHRGGCRTCPDLPPGERPPLPTSGSLACSVFGFRARTNIARVSGSSSCRSKASGSAHRRPLPDPTPESEAPPLRRGHAQHPPPPPRARVHRPPTRRGPVVSTRPSLSLPPDPASPPCLCWGPGRGRSVGPGQAGR